ncbi:MULTISPECIES: SAM-dependent methyltransferase [unclassified Solwaraspora]|uniref:TRM11 family SAM-dependent methyltransferase n=1 Tax=unclassified Solwaraspora TaxID=2627926 RepID=UPI00248B4303|nr:MULTISPECIES: SAM-dependent methyltransferase [unclassified Solwaraspora]WBB98692.1 SAM-dependent methyltransferase [Solwaraspora sp. WMMA2059]WBC22755.1 SAM-dependent methyltransferase [Solwaraspora sp. WMMA2080]WJK35193.1 SAM-dependent methyltransferase [Solwaraspora sp. WMMA2065]
MTSYALLIHPSANRVYAESAVGLAAAELGVFADRALGGRVDDVAVTTIGGLPYVTFTGVDLTDRDLSVLANLSARYAFFARDGDLLRPLEVTGRDRFDSDLITIPKYAGKTNEQFTKLLLNVTVLATADRVGTAGTIGTGGTAVAAGAAAGPLGPDSPPLRVLDPMCGRGTTLNQAMMYGWHAAGVEIDGKDFEVYANFIRTWLKHKRLKHSAEIALVRRNRAVLGRRLAVTLAASKDDHRAGRTVDLTMVHADTRRSREVFRAGSFDAIVTDAPYGVQHGTRGQADRLTRDPLGLLAEALPGWVALLRPGGALGISWNTLVAARDDLAALLVKAGLEVADGPGYGSFAHRVDQAIVRDLIVAQRA